MHSARAVSHLEDTDTEAQEARSRQRAERAKLDAQREVDDTKWLMGSKRGRRIVWRQLERAGVFRLSFNTNAMQMAFAEGGRNEGLKLLAMVHQHCPELYVDMLKEQTE